MARKIYCGVVEGAVWEDRCLFKLREVIDGNKDCESCILREIENLKQCGSKKEEAGEKRRRGRRGSAKKSKGVPGESARGASVLNIGELSALTGEAGRTLQELAQQGKIPGKKTGRGWEFSRTEIEDWLSGKTVSSSSGADPAGPEGESLDNEGAVPAGKSKEGPEEDL